MKKHIDSFNKQKCLTVVAAAAKGAKFKTTQQQCKTDTLGGSVDTKLRKKNDYVLFNPPRDTKIKSKIAVPKSSLPVLNEKASHEKTLTSKLLEDLPVKPKKRIGTTSQLDNYCLFDPKTDFFNEREHVLGTIPETHAVDSSSGSSTFMNFPDNFNNINNTNNVNNTTTESYDYFDEMYNDDGCEIMLAEMSNVKEINDSKTNISLFIRMPTLSNTNKMQNKAIQYSRDVTAAESSTSSLLQMENQSTTLQNDIQTAAATSDSMNIHELITVINEKHNNRIM